MVKKNKLWFSGEDAQLAARFTKCLTKALYNRRASYLRAKAEEAANEISIEECSEEVDKRNVPLARSVEEIVESKLMWESIRKYLHKLTPKECEVIILLYVEQLSVSDTAAKLGVEKSTVSTHRCNACEKIRKEMAENCDGSI